MKKSRLIPFLTAAVMLTACSSNDSYSESAAFSSPSSEGITNGVSFDKSNVYDGGYSGGSMDNNDYSEETAKVNENKSSSPESGDEASASLRKEMLVYSCSMNIDVLDFDAAVSSFKSSLDSYKGFIESENYSDGGSSSRWYDENSQKWQSYTATVRVPSADYDSFCNMTSELGNLRSKNASVENVTTEYYDLNTTLEIYEAKEQRYLKLLSTIDDEEYAIAVEKELTDIQIEIARIKTRMNSIKTDVAYSYVYLTINEVKEYQPEPVKTDTFLDRLGNTVSDSAKDFADFLEGFLFLLIYFAPYLVILGIIIAVIVKSKKKRKAKNAPVPVQAPAEETAPADAAENAPSEKAEKSDKDKKDGV